LPKSSRASITSPKGLPAVTTPGGGTATVSRVAAAGVTVMGPVVAAARPLLEAWGGEPLGAFGRGGSAKAATPRAGAPGAGPNAAPPGLRARVSATVPVKVGSMLPKSSSAAMIASNPLPAVTLFGGCVVTARRVAGAAETVRPRVVAGESASPELDTCSV